MDSIRPARDRGDEVLDIVGHPDRMQDGTHGTSAVQTGGYDPSSARDRLIRSAAYAAGCTAAVLYTSSDCGLAVSGCSGAQACLTAETERWLLAEAAGIPPEGVLVIGDAARNLGPAVTGLTLADGAPVRFLAAVHVRAPDGRLRGVLVVADHLCHGGLNPAQTYVLTTHGLQIGIHLKARSVYGPRQAGQPEVSSTERLRLLESVVVHANDAVLITEAEPIDLPGPRIVYCNAAFTKTTGYTEAEVLGRTPRLLQSPHVDRPTLDRLRRSLERWEPIEVELLNVRKDGTEFWVELSIVPVADETGWYTHWVSVQRDVSHRKKAEEVATRARIAEVENRALAAEIQERKRTEERLLHAAFHDDLTQLWNRAYLMDRLALMLAPAEEGSERPGSHRRRVGCSVLFLDLDRFKLINDSLGHSAGDRLLVEVARRLRTCVRPQDILARIGGDEFAVLIDGLDGISIAVEVAERIIAALSQPVTLGKHDVFAMCSVGVVQATELYRRPEELLRDADLAMYDAKKRGCGGYAIFNNSMHAGAVEVLALQTDLRQAIAGEQFRLHYQPIYDLAGGRLTGLEALIRWEHPRRGLVSPETFIPMAEEIGVIRDIGRWVLREACDQMRRWQAEDVAFDPRISVNVSGDELRERGFIPELRAVLRASGLDPRRLQLEITESVFLRHPEAVGRVLKRIRAMGVRIALDDFGTGYSSLGYLDQYQIDTIKIDRSFVARMLRQRRTMSILDGIVRLGTALGIDIVAEGVENEAQLQKLRSMHCGHVQGYLLGRPTPTPGMAMAPRGKQSRSRVRFDSAADVGAP